MTQYFQINADNPQQRLISQAVVIIRNGGIVAYPTDSCYALGCKLGNKEALDKIRKIRQIDKNHNMTLICHDLSNISNYARLDNSSFRMMKSLTPGPFTFILKANRDVPRRLQHPKRKTIGLRVPGNNIILSILEYLGEPLLNTSLILPDNQMPMTDPDEIRKKLDNQVELVIDGGNGGFEPTTVIDLVESYPKIIRKGKGDLSNIDPGT